MGTQPRSKIVDPSVTRWCHCIARCVRVVFLFVENQEFDRMERLDQRIKELDSIFSVSVAGFRLVDNHLHLLLRIDSEATWRSVERKRGMKPLAGTA